MNDTLLSTLSSSSAETTEAIVVDSKYPYALGIFMFAAVLLDLWLLLLVLNKLQQRKARLCCTDCKRTSQTEERNERILYWSYLTAMTSVIPYLVSNVPFFLDCYKNKHNLLVFTALNAVFGSILVFSAYFILWFKVHMAFYLCPWMKDSVSKVEKFIHYSVVGLLGVLTIFGRVYLSFEMWPIFVRRNCPIHDVIDLNTKLYYLVSACSAIFHVLHLFSLLYPVFRHRRRMANDNFDATSVIKKLKRSVALTVTGIFFELFYILVVIGSVSSSNSSVFVVMFTIHTIGILVVLILSLN